MPTADLAPLIALREDLIKLSEDHDADRLEHHVIYHLRNIILHHFGVNLHEEPLLECINGDCDWTGKLSETEMKMYCWLCPKCRWVVKNRDRMVLSVRRS